MVFRDLGRASGPDETLTSQGGVEAERPITAAPIRLAKACRLASTVPGDRDQTVTIRNAKRVDQGLVGRVGDPVLAFDAKAAV